MMNSLGRIMPSDAAQIIQDYMLNLADSGSKSLISVSIIAALWTASKAINALMRALNIVYEVNETRGYFKIRLMGMFYTFLFALSIILALVLPSMSREFFGFLEAYFYIPKYFVDFFTSIRWVSVLGFLALVFGSTHVVLPNVRMGFKEAMPGAIFSLIGWLTLSYGFSHFVQNFSRFTIVYGSLAAVMVLLIWMYFSSIIVMFGAEINHYLMKRRTNQGR
jgi:membrane protein